MFNKGLLTFKDFSPIVNIIHIKIEGLVDEINKFYDVDLWEFPRLKPGNTNIKVSRNDCNIKIKYKTRYS